MDAANRRKKGARLWLMQPLSLNMSPINRTYRRSAYARLSGMKC